jgi:hypothetical protein
MNELGAMERSIVSDKTDFCIARPDGLYDDPENCEKFIICYFEQTFRTKCADGTQWNHFNKECDYPELGWLDFPLSSIIKVYEFILFSYCFKLIVNGKPLLLR